ncbi:branched-chain amino acid ABC transporter substrate-binding protein [Aquirhabdus parva]|uniref:Branched-chain amino acid ABC transporter substrate-binding protein n=1 Tax=Aquirhabdus parva TaxID=2283318 RepID=A0A345P3Y1_9GAMM|nr:branched-chain amino acid ABC transporter substrate-binding protein [Aquirhabdus parva]AXI01990.1 branched-chain amino acid ABC transporter substrate-binding protein [Aquirhabdus parva]
MNHLNSKKIVLTALTVAVATSLTLAGCSKKDSSASSGDTLEVKIGHSAPLTGAQAHLGKDAQNGAQLAVDELNTQGVTIAGKKAHFTLDPVDDQADARIATTVAQQLVDDKVSGVIGHLNSSTTLPASRIYHQNGIVQISPSATNPTYTQQGFSNAFRVMANDVQQGRALGTFAVNDLKVKHIAVIDDKTAYGAGLAAEFEKAVKAANGNLIAHEYTTDKETDFNAILTRIKGKSPDLVFFAGMDGQGAAMAQQVRNLGLNAQFMGADGIYTPEFMKLAGKNAEGTIASLPGAPLASVPKGPDFEKRFSAKYGPIQLYGAYNYDAVMVMVDAMKRANSIDPKVYVEKMKDANWPGVTTTISFDDKGDLKKASITLYKVEGGKWVPLKTVE